MLRSHSCGELRIEDINKHVTLCGWIKKIRKLGGMVFIDLRDRFGITQLVFDLDKQADLFDLVDKLNREFVIQVKGVVNERSNKNLNIPTGEIEIVADSIKILSTSKIPPFTIEDETDGGEELRMKYRYLDIRRDVVRNKLELRHKIAIETRNYLNGLGFLEIETPMLIKSTPEGARDFIVPSRMNQGQFYALPQSPQTFKQLLMVAGLDRYFQIVRCFRDEDLRADRQPEFTQIDCEMSFVDREDILIIFEGLIKYLFKKIKNVNFDTEFPRISYDDAMRYYGSDKPDIRFGMKFVDLSNTVKNKDFKVFNNAEAVLAIVAKDCSEYSRKQLDELTDFVKRPQVGVNGLVYVKYNKDGSFKSSVDKFYDTEDLQNWANLCKADKGDLILILAGDLDNTRKALCELRLEMGNRLELRSKNIFAPLWVTDFPLLEWDEETQRYYAMHHPFTSPKEEDICKLENDPGNVKANAYDLVMNGVELGGGSIRIHDKELQNRMFKALGFTQEKAKKQFGFLLEAFEYGAPPHGGIAFGFDRLCAMMGEEDSIRDFIAFPKNNSGRDLMAESPSKVSEEQLKELGIKLDIKE
ncbi:MAG: aspartate--tRNA ligase [Bacteroidales bacterium]|jgi:aspartyl-tRNA synthetase